MMLSPLNGISGELTFKRQEKVNKNGSRYIIENAPPAKQLIHQQKHDRE